MIIYCKVCKKKIDTSRGYKFHAGSKTEYYHNECKRPAGGK